MRDFLELTPLIIPILLFLTPIVAILTAHQRKMAELMHMRQAPQRDFEMESLRSEIRELKQLLHEQTLAIDNLTSRQARNGHSAVQFDMRERIAGTP